MNRITVTKAVGKDVYEGEDIGWHIMGGHLLIYKSVSDYPMRIVKIYNGNVNSFVYVDIEYNVGPKMEVSL